MPLVKCPDCGKKISDAAPACIGCGRPMKKVPERAPPLSPGRKIKTNQLPAGEGPIANTIKGCLYALGVIICLLVVIILLGTYISEKKNVEKPANYLTSGNSGLQPYSPQERGLRNLADVSTAERERIYYQMVQYQDSGVGDMEAYRLASRIYNISLDDLGKIAIQGMRSNWDKPPIK